MNNTFFFLQWFFKENDREKINVRHKFNVFRYMYMYYKYIRWTDQQKLN